MRSTSAWLKGMAESSSSRKEWLAALLLLSCIAVFICDSTSGLTVSVLYLRQGRSGSGVGLAEAQDRILLREPHTRGRYMLPV